MLLSPGTKSLHQTTNQFVQCQQSKTPKATTLSPMTAGKESGTFAWPSKYWQQWVSRVVQPHFALLLCTLPILHCTASFTWCTLTHVSCFVKPARTTLAERGAPDVFVGTHIDVAHVVQFCCSCNLAGVTRIFSLYFRLCAQWTQWTFPQKQH